MAIIACWDDFSEGFNASGSECPSYSEWQSNVADGYSVEISGSYAATELVELSDITVSESVETIRVTTVMYAGAYGYGVTVTMACDNKLLVSTDGEYLPQLGLDGSDIIIDDCEEYEYTNDIPNKQGFGLYIRLHAPGVNYAGSKVYLFEEFTNPLDLYSEPPMDNNGNRVGTWEYDPNEDQSFVTFSYYTSENYVGDIMTAGYLVVMSGSYSVTV